MRNKNVRGIQLSQYVTSWVKSGGTLEKGMRNGASGFKDWLQLFTIGGEFLTRSEVDRIFTYAMTGDTDLEGIAKGYLNAFASKD